MSENFIQEILNVNNLSFENLAMSIFHFQAKHCQPYADYLKNLGAVPDQINKITEIPFLPIGFFKSKKVISSQLATQNIFESSGTTGPNTSKHFVADTDFYKEISLEIFEKSYGPIEKYHIIALLPSYLENQNSSLIFMIKHFIEMSKSSLSGFYLGDYDQIMRIFDKIIQKNDRKKILLWGVTFALIDFIENGFDFENYSNILTVLETGGMKGRKKEMIKEELYQKLKLGFSVENIHSEYGMTELLSQAYSQNDAVFTCPKTMKVYLREINDPFKIIPKKNDGKTGGINIIDLANIDSCCFIETQDIGQYGKKMGTFKVLGRFDNSDVRGCNLLVI